MRISSSARQLSSLLLVTLFLITQATAQQKQPPTPTPPRSAVQTQPSKRPEDETTFDMLLAARSYKLYGEVRMVGQLARSSGVKELLEPARLLGAPPPEVTGIIEFLNANADLLATSRLMFAAMPARPALPQTFVAIELASAQDALKLEPKLRTFLSSFGSSPAAPTAQSGGARKPQASPKQQASPAPQRVFVKRAGSLIVASDTSFTLQSLRPDGSQPLSADPNFQRVRSRFASEALFLYYDVNLAQYVTKPRVTVEVIAPSPPPQARKNKSSGQADESLRPAQPPPPQVITPENSPPGVTVTNPTGAPPAEEIPHEPVETESVGQGSQRSAGPLPTFLLMFGLAFGDAPSWPEAVGLAATLEGDDVIVRAVVVNAPGAPNAVIPLIPSLISGPEIAPQASTLSPAETDLFISTSLDFPRIYDAFLKSMKSSQRPDENGPLPAQGDAGSASFETQIAVFEQLLGFKIKEDLLPALGNEVAVNIPFSWFNRGPNSGIQTSGEASTAAAAQSSEPGFVLFISLNDKERVRDMLPRVLEVLGLKAPGAPGQIERRAGIEITSYGQASTAIIDDFLAVSQDVAALRSVVDAHENNQTLATNPAFKNSTAWQSSRVLGQVYLSSAFTTMPEPFVQLDDQLQDFLARFTPKPSPITFESLNDGTGFFHELHLPKDWVALVMAGLTAERKPSPITDNELRAVFALTSIREAQKTYKAGTGKGSFATRDQLVSESLVSKELLEMNGYRIEITTNAGGFVATATPTEYGKTGRQSFYLDESGIIRGADHGGQPATVADKPL